MLHALGYYRPDEVELDLDTPDAERYGADAMEAVDRFRADEGWQLAVAGFVDERTVERIWRRLAEEGLDERIRSRILELARVSR